MAKFKAIGTEDTASYWFDLENQEEAYSSEYERLHFNKRTIIAGSGVIFLLFFATIVPIVIH